MGILYAVTSRGSPHFHDPFGFGCNSSGDALSEPTLGYGMIARSEAQKACARV